MRDVHRRTWTAEVKNLRTRKRRDRYSIVDRLNIHLPIARVGHRVIVACGKTRDSTGCKASDSVGDEPFPPFGSVQIAADFMPEFDEHYLFTALLEQFGDERRPACLMTCAKPLPSIAVEVFVEHQV